MPANDASDQLAAQIIQTWLDGAPPDATAVLAARPELATEKSVVLDLAMAEFLVRKMRGEQPDPEAFCARFPAYHASLGRMLAQQSVGGSADDDRADGLGERTVEIPIVPHSDPEDVLKTPGTLTSAGSPASPSAPGSARPAAWPAPGARVGDFNLLRQMGKGAFGRVFLALEEPTTRHVVVKLTRQKCDEAKVLGKVGHGNVVSVLSAPHDVASGLYLIVMPFLGTATFEDLLELAYPMAAARPTRPRRADVILKAAARNHHTDDPEPEGVRTDPLLRRGGFVDGVVWLGTRVAEALAAVHRCGYVHHDLKPSNILLGLDGQPRLLDFNLASDVQNTKSRLGGTLPYMPPEHLEAVRRPDAATSVMDVRGDVYSLGVILYELVTGVHPFGRIPKSKSVKAVAGEMLTRQQAGIRPVRDLNPDVPPRLARLVERCLAYDPAARPQTAAAVAGELRRCHTASRRARQFFGSRPGRALVTAAAVAVVSTGSWYAANSARAGAPVSYREQGMIAYARGQMADATAALTKAAQDDPADADVGLALGRARLATGEARAARASLEQVVRLRPAHGPAHATLGWCLAADDRYPEALAALARADDLGYRPAGLDALRAYIHNRLRQDTAAAAAAARALATDPTHRPARIARGTLAFNLATAKLRPLTADELTDVERALTAGAPDGNLAMWAAHMYAWTAAKPPFIKGAWAADAPAAKERCRQLLKVAVENGFPATWKEDSRFQNLFGNPDDLARDWKLVADPHLSAMWQTGDPLTEFPG